MEVFSFYGTTNHRVLHCTRGVVATVQCRRSRIPRVGWHRSGAIRDPKLHQGPHGEGKPSRAAAPLHGPSASGQCDPWAVPGKGRKGCFLCAPHGHQHVWEGAVQPGGAGKGSGEGITREGGQGTESDTGCSISVAVQSHHESPAS